MSAPASGSPIRVDPYDVQDIQQAVSTSVGPSLPLPTKREEEGGNLVANHYAESNSDNSMKATDGADNESARRHREEGEQTYAYLVQLDAMRDECVAVGRFRDAQRCVDRAREVCLRYARLILRESDAVHTRSARPYLIAQQRNEMTLLKRHWSSALKAFDSQAAALLTGLENTQKEELATLAAAHDQQLFCLRPPASVFLAKEGLGDVQHELERLVAAREYIRADLVQRDIHKAQKEAAEQYALDIKAGHRAQLTALARKMNEEWHTMSEELAQRRRQLLLQQDSEIERLEKKHRSAVHKMDIEVAALRSRARALLEKQVTAFENDPSKMGMELVEMARRVRCELDVALPEGKKKRRST